MLFIWGSKLNTIIFLLVSEGVSDHEVLKLVLREIGKTKGLDIQLELISPALDETTKIRERGGWGNVQAWCKKHGSVQVKNDFTIEDRNSLEQAGFKLDFLPSNKKHPSWESFVALSGAAGLFVHLDADIAEKINDIAINYCDSGLSRKDYCKHAIRTWIGTDEDSQLCFVTPSYCLETWYLATHDNLTDPGVIPDQIENYETVENVISLLLSLGYDGFTDENTGLITVDKKSLTEKHSGHLIDNFSVSLSRCPELQRVYSYISKL